MGKRLLGKWSGLLAAFYYGFLPFNVYFTRVVLPDPLAVCLALVGLYLFLEYYFREKVILLLGSAVLFSASILIKPFGIFYGVPVLYLVLRKYGVKKLFKQKAILVALNIVLIPFFLWRGWMNNNPEHLKGIAHLKWAFNGDRIRFRPAFWRWIFGERLGRLILGIWGMVPFSFGLVAGEKKQGEGKNFILLFLVGMVLYVTIIATANVRHDYYQVFVIPAVVLTLAWGSVLMWKGGGFNKWMTRGLLAFSVFLMMGISLYEVKGFYAINHPEIVKAGRAADKLLPKDAWVVAPYNGDTTFLYQTGRWGWPVVNESIEGIIEKGADYYVSVNMDDDTNNFMNRFAVVERTGDYVILDLHKQI
jgi:4-amino-4-deoxy-L-arabinose transferase-like glycosyltransferase